MRALLTAGDRLDLDGLPARVDDVHSRAEALSGAQFGPFPVTLGCKPPTPRVT